MFEGKKIIVVLPAYNAEKTLRRTCREIPFPLVDEVLLVDDCSRDRSVARELGLRTIVHSRNPGYGANQKACSRAVPGASRIFRGDEPPTAMGVDREDTPGQ